MKQHERAPFDRALRDARLEAYPPGQFVGQEGLMTASQVLAIASEAGIAPGVSVLDLCCGVAGPGRLVTRASGCRYLGVDASASAVRLARERAGGLGCRFEVSHVPPISAGPFDVVLLLETMLAFADKAVLLEQVTGALTRRGRFAFTLEEGKPLTDAERECVPDADTVWLTPLEEMISGLERVGMHVRWLTECSESHRTVAEAMVAALEAHGPAISEQVGQRALDDLLDAHRFWSYALRGARVRKFALVAEK